MVAAGGRKISRVAPFDCAIVNAAALEELIRDYKIRD